VRHAQHTQSRVGRGDGDGGGVFPGAVQVAGELGLAAVLSHVVVHPAVPHAAWATAEALL
jgi:hypothetical protein